MDEQLNLFADKIDLSSSAQSEAAFFHEVYPLLSHVIDQNSDDPSNLEYRPNSGYFAFVYKGAVLCRYKLHGKSNWLAFPLKLRDFIPAEYLAIATCKDGFYRVRLDEPADARQFVEAIGAMLDYMIDYGHKEYSCCGYYMECSKVGYCVEENKDIASECRYKINLKHGRNFYQPAE